MCPSNARPRESARSTLQRAVRIACTGGADLRLDDVDEGFWEAATRAGLLPLVASVVDPGRAQLPDDVRAQVIRTAMHHLRTVSGLRSIAKVLDDRGLRWLVIKGPVLADVVYRIRGLRAYADLDIVVHPHDLDAALTALQAAGAELLDRNWQHIRRTQQSEISLLLAQGTLLDLHWHVISNPDIRADVALDIDAFFRSAVPVTVGGLAVHTLNPIDTLCYVALHAALAGGHQLRWLVDIQQCLNWARPQLSELPQRARQLGCELALTVMLRRVATHIDPSAKVALQTLDTRRLWFAIGAAVDRIAPLDPAIDQYSGRAVLSSTRATTGQSLRALASSLARVRSWGRSRRTAVVDVSALRAVGGRPADREAWLELARAHAPPTATTLRDRDVRT